MKILDTSSTMNNSNKRIIILLLGICLLFITFMSLSMGRVSVPLKDLWNLAVGGEVPATARHVIINLRLPRVLAAIFVGAALSVSGLVYQGIFQNPLVSPDLLGVSSGACAGAALSIIFGIGGIFLTALSFSFGIITVALCVGLSMITGRKSNLVLVFSGIIIGKFMDSFVGILKYFADPESQLGDIVNWQLGSLSKVTIHSVAIIVPVISIGLIIALLYRWRINLLSIGEKDAFALGVNIKVDRTILIIISTMLTATSVCFCGTISWIGLIVPHIARWIVGSDNRYAMPLSVLLGSNFMVISDLVARGATDYELPLGVITGFCGAPVFAFILIKRAKDVL